MFLKKYEEKFFLRKLSEYGAYSFKSYLLDYHWYKRELKRDAKSYYIDFHNYFFSVFIFAERKRQIKIRNYISIDYNSVSGDTELKKIK